MRIEAILSREDVAELVSKFVPLEIELGKVGTGERLVAIDEVSSVTLVADAGVRVACTAHLRWPVLGLNVPVRVKALEVLVRPSIETRGEHPSLVFTLIIERADIAWAPALIEGSVMERVNRELAEQHVELTWNFAGTLSHAFDLPFALRTAATLGLEVVEGKVKVTEAALGMSVAFACTVTRRATPAP
jgi:hypothetical protein